jgi:hypothetical protein
MPGCFGLLPGKTDATIPEGREVCRKTDHSGRSSAGGMVKHKAFLTVSMACILASSYAAAQSPPQRAPGGGPPLTTDHPKQQTAPIAPSQQAAPAPLSPEQMPSSPPQVSFNSGILTIIANNSTLGDILRAVHRQTGAAVDTPGNATERVVGKFGPGPARDVLSSLLNGSHFNYVLLGSATNPNALDRVMLISRSIGTEQPAQQANAAAPLNSAPPAAVMPQPAENGEVSNEEAGDMPQDSADTLDDQGNPEQPEDQQQQQNGAFGPAGAVKTPEQLLQELQQRQQQIQQQQQPGAPQSFPPAPLGGAQPPQPPH